MNANEVRQWSAEDKLALCGVDEHHSEVDDGAARANCYSYTRAWLSHAQAVEVCGSGSNTTAVKGCLKAVQFLWSKENAVKLCSGAQGTGPHDCARHAGSLHPMGMFQPGANAATLCRESQLNPKKYSSSQHGDQLGAGTVDCAHQAVSALNFATDEAIELCRHADSTHPVVCANAAKYNSLLTPLDIAAICATAPHPAAAGKCAIACPFVLRKSNLGLEIKACAAVCNGASHADSGVCLSALMKPHGLQRTFGTDILERAAESDSEKNEIVRMVVELCSGEGGEHPVACVSKANFKEERGAVPTALKVSACAGIAADESILERIGCVNSGPPSFDLSARIKLCNGTTTSATINRPKNADRPDFEESALPSFIEAEKVGDGSAQCANLLVSARLPTIQEADIIALCRVEGSASRDAWHGKQRAACFMRMRPFFAQQGGGSHSPNMSDLDAPVSLLTLITDAAVDMCRNHHYFAGTSRDSTSSPSCLLDIAKSGTVLLAKAKSSFPTIRNAKTFQLAKKLSTLCGHAQDEAPATCFRAAVVEIGAGFKQSALLCSTHQHAVMCCMRKGKRTMGKEMLAMLGAETSNGLQTLCEGTTALATCGGPGECMGATKRLNTARFLSNRPQQLAELCSAARSEYPAFCAMQLHRSIPGLTPEEIVRVCSSRSSNNNDMSEPSSLLNDPMRCFLTAKHMVLSNRLGSRTREFFVELCTPGKNGPQAALCVKEYISAVGGVAQPSHEQLHAIARLCKGSHNGMASVHCVVKAPRALRTSSSNELLRETLCADLQDDSSAYENTFSASEQQQEWQIQPFGPLLCAKEAFAPPFSSGAVEVVQLCSGAHDAGPARCYADLLARTMSSSTEESRPWRALTTAQRHGLCAGTRADTFGQTLSCFALLRGRMNTDVSVEDALDICRQSMYPVSSAECTLHAIKRNADVLTAHPVFAMSSVLELCSQVHAPDPGLCARHAPAHLSDAETIKLCRGLDKDRAMQPLQCLSSATNLRLGWSAMVELCRPVADSMFTTDARVACVRKASFALKSVLVSADVAALCRIGSAPNRPCPVACLQRLSQTSSLSTRHSIQICQEVAMHSVEAVSPVDCVEKLGTYFKPHESDIIVHLCSRNNRTTTTGGIQTTLPTNGTWLCFEEAPSLWSTIERAVLCRGAESVAPAMCANTLQHSTRLSNLNVIRVCAQSRNEAPIKCSEEIHASGQSVPEHIAAAQCIGAETDTPFKCLLYTIANKYQGNALDVVHADVEACRRALAVPSALHVGETAHLAAMLRPKNGFLQSDIDLGPINILLVDQFGNTMATDLVSPGVYTVTVALRDKTGRYNEHTMKEALQGPTTSVFKVQKEHEGKQSERQEYGLGQYSRRKFLSAVFSPLILNGVWGDLELTFSVIGSRTIASVTLMLHVQRNLEMMFKQLFSCENGPLRLQCLLDSEDDTLQLIPWPWSAVAATSKCHATLLSMGVDVIDTGKLLTGPTVVRIQPGSAKLLSMTGVPTQDMLPWEVLGVSENTTSSELRRAYYKSSLEWHPDRWTIFHPELQVRAASVFTIIASANQQMSTALKSAPNEQPECSQSAGYE